VLVAVPRMLPLLVVTALLAAVAISPAPARGSAGETRAEILLPGRWLRGATGSDGAWLLLADAPDAPRRLLGLHWREGRVRAVAEGLPPALHGVMPAPASGSLLLLTGPGTLLTVDGATGAVTEVLGAGEILGPGGGTFARSATPWLADARLGVVRPVRLAGAALEPLGTHALPIGAERAIWGLRLSSPPLAFAGSWLVAGPHQEGRRVRTLLLGAGGERVEQVSLLPEPEQISDRAVVVVDGRPLLVLGTFRGLGIASKKRLRVFALDGRGGDAGSPPLLARELPTRVWHEMQARAADLDGDGREDLVITTAEGLSGDGVTFTVFRGRGDGRLDPQPRSASVAAKNVSWRYGDVTGDGLPDLVTLAEGRLAVHAAGGPTGLPPKKATSTHTLGSAAPPPREQVQVSVGSGGSRVERRSEGEAPAEDTAAGAGAGGASGADEAPAGEGASGATASERGEDSGAAGWSLLDLDGDGTLEVVRWEPAPAGQTRLTVVGIGPAPR
jgi:hypothetical protein